MAGSEDRASRIDVLVLSTLARLPMHGYELKLELRYRYVRWWAKFEHGHLYAALARLNRRRLIRRRAVEGTARKRTVYELTTAGRAHLRRTMERFVLAEDSTYFDVDLFLAGAFVLERRSAVKLLERRAERIDEQLAEAKELQRAMLPHVPAAARLIMEHRIEHLAREVEFARRAAKVFSRQKDWRPFLGDQRIAEFLAATRVTLEAQ